MAKALDPSSLAALSDGTATRVEAGISINILHRPTAAHVVGAGALVLSGTLPEHGTPLLLAVIDQALQGRAL